MTSNRPLRKFRPRWIALGLIAMLGISLAAVDRAQASNCASFDACYLSVVQHRTAARNAFIAGALYNKASEQSAAKGQYAAALVYKAAANQKFGEAGLHNAAADQESDRAITLGGGFTGGGVDGPNPGRPVPGACDPQGGDACAASAQKMCTPRPLITEWDGKVAGHVVYQAVTGTSWCWRGREIVSRHTNWSEHHFTDLGRNLGLTEHQPYIEPHSACHPFNGVTRWDCLVRIQYGFDKKTGITRTYGGCIGVRIYSAETHTPNYANNHYDGNCKTTN